MSSVRLGSNDLLEYDERYKVLICRQCKYAIQKSAIPSHLLRHKIYRSQREQLLSSITQLDLLEPDQVPLPNPTSPPVNALPVIPGYRCSENGCAYLCASSTRVRRHLRENHPSCASQQVKLQTFFRGTKLRYFEVNASPASLESTIHEDDADGTGQEGHEEQGLDAETTSPVLQTSPQVPTPAGSSPVSFDLESMSYFHHFITSTSLALDEFGDSPPTTQYWQTDVVSQALERRWLMSGILALSACHLAALSISNDGSMEQRHVNLTVQFSLEFSNGWDALAVKEQALAGGQIMCKIHCARCALSTLSSDQGLSPDEAGKRLMGFLDGIRGSADLQFVPSFSSVRNACDDREVESFAQATRLLKMKRSTNSESVGGIPSQCIIPSELLDRILALSSRMAKAFGKPKNHQDALVALSAIAALVECCSPMFDSDTAEANCPAVARWWKKVPYHFHHMVLLRKPAALVVVAYWAASLVKRIEDRGFWLLRRSTERIITLIDQQLPEDEHEVRGLIEGLIPL